MARGNIRKRTRNDGTTAYQVRVDLPNDPATGSAALARRNLRHGAGSREGAYPWLSEADEGAVVLPSKIVDARPLPALA